MRAMLMSTVVALGFLVASLLAQERPQRGTVKRFDTQQGVVTIETADGKEVQCEIAPQTIFHGADNQDLPGARERGVPAGTTVMFRTMDRGGKMFLAGMKLAGNAPAKGGAQGGAKGRPAGAPPSPRESIGVKPLTELGNETYKGESGGLYGGGKNEPPPALQTMASAAANRIQPLDEQGQPAASGKIVLLAIGMSNTTQEFAVFKALADKDPDKSDRVLIVDGAQGGQAATQWTDPKSETGRRVWGTVEQRLKAAGASDHQVQVVWIKQALIQQGQHGEFRAHAKKLEQDLATTLQLLKERFPNLQLAYMSSRIYGGYATTALNPEPYAYEGAFSIRWIIDAQLAGKPELNADPARGPVRAPVVLWGPYLWADGMMPRADGLIWKRDDLVERDGTHPSDSGRQKVAQMLMKFVHEDPYAKSWYLSSTKR